MPNNATAKTAWAHNKRVFLVLIAAVGLLAAAWGIARLPDTRSLAVGGYVFNLETATTRGSQSKGLAGRDSLPPDQGMLFIYQQPKPRCMWMKGMQFPIDIVWLNADKKVVHIESYVAPESYPKSFCSKDAATYVIELPPGSIERTGVHKGQTLNF